jgi:hypothetical protein
MWGRDAGRTRDEARPKEASRSGGLPDGAGVPLRHPAMQGALVARAGDAAARSGRALDAADVLAEVADER